MPWTDADWWEADVDKEVATEALRSIGLEPTGWTNRRPVYDQDVDWLTVEACVRGNREPIPEPEATTEAPKRMRRKRGA